MRRVVIALANTLALVFTGLALVAGPAAAWVVWGLAGLLWAAVPFGLIAAALSILLGWLAEREDGRP